MDRPSDCDHLFTGEGEGCEEPFEHDGTTRQGRGRKRHVVRARMHAECSGDSAPRESVLPRLDIQSGVDRPRSPIAPLCIVVPVSGIAVISVLHDCAPKIHREAFATLGTSLGKPCRVPKGPFPGVVYSSVDRAPGTLLEKASVRDRGCLGFSRMPPECARTCRCDSVMNSAAVPAPVASGLVVCLLFRSPSRSHLVDPAFFCHSCLHARMFVSDCRVTNSNPGFGQGFSCRKPVGPKRGADKIGLLSPIEARFPSFLVFSYVHEIGIVLSFP
ncbi:hypothetical protein CRG98_046405 [Punica granatum]|uniref:Uncharacterized protein n=1 Tax=Punica granatum TaxID=22663 RepID=A0A2I0HN92_PUNGR|nr:hypothetical protein CRG98_046405 [Punica granatum]